MTRFFDATIARRLTRVPLRVLVELHLQGRIYLPEVNR